MIVFIYMYNDMYVCINIYISLLYITYNYIYISLIYQKILLNSAWLAVSSKSLINIYNK